jgi:hypothetical protein
MRQKEVFWVFVRLVWLGSTPYTNLLCKVLCPGSFQPFQDHRQAWNLKVVLGFLRVLLTSSASMWLFDCASKGWPVTYILSKMCGKGIRLSDSVGWSVYPYWYAGALQCSKGLCYIEIHLMSLRGASFADVACATKKRPALTTMLWIRHNLSFYYLDCRHTLLLLLVTLTLYGNLPWGVLSPFFAHCACLWINGFKVFLAHFEYDLPWMTWGSPKSSRSTAAYQYYLEALKPAKIFAQFSPTGIFSVAKVELARNVGS